MDRAKCPKRRRSNEEGQETEHGCRNGIQDVVVHPRICTAALNGASETGHYHREKARQGNDTVLPLLLATLDLSHMGLYETHDPNDNREDTDYLQPDV